MTGAVADSGRFWTPKRRRIYIGAAIILTLFACWSALRSWRDSHGFLINTTQSLPNWAFILDTKTAPSKHSLIFFRPPSSAIMEVHFGKGEHLFGKRVFGVPGDVVTRKDRTFFVNGEKVAVAKTVSKRGVLLELGPTGVIPNGCYYVGSEHPDGFDSRYGQIGWICRERVVGVGQAVL